MHKSFACACPGSPDRTRACPKNLASLRVEREDMAGAPFLGGGGQENTVFPDDRGRPALAGDGGFPQNVLRGIPYQRKILLQRKPWRVGPRKPGQSSALVIGRRHEKTTSSRIERVTEVLSYLTGLDGDLQWVREIEADFPNGNQVSGVSHTLSDGSNVRTMEPIARDNCRQLPLRIDHASPPGRRRGVACYARRSVPPEAWTSVHAGPGHIPFTI